LCAAAPCDHFRVSRSSSSSSTQPCGSSARLLAHRSSAARLCSTSGSARPRSLPAASSPSCLPTHHHHDFCHLQLLNLLLPRCYQATSRSSSFSAPPSPHHSTPIHDKTQHPHPCTAHYFTLLPIPPFQHASASSVRPTGTCQTPAARLHAGRRCRTLATAAERPLPGQTPLRAAHSSATGVVRACGGCCGWSCMAGGVLAEAATRLQGPCHRPACAAAPPRAALLSPRPPSSALEQAGARAGPCGVWGLVQKPRRHAAMPGSVAVALPRPPVRRHHAPSSSACLEAAAARAAMSRGLRAV
jgi:hypothetical protein